MVEGTKALTGGRRKQSEGGKKGAAKRWAHRWRYWSALMARQRASGLSVEVFCAQEGVHRSSFFSWRRRLALVPRRSAGSPEGETRVALAVPSASGFVELVPGGGPGSGSGLRLQLPGRVVIELDRGFDRDALKSALTVLLESR